MAGAYDSANKSGLKPYHLTGVFHWLQYPQLATHRNVPDDASFKRERERQSSEDTIRLLYVELIEALAQALPCDPVSRAETEALIPGGGSCGKDIIRLRLPEKAATALRDLWHFLHWHSYAAYHEGFTDGRNLLSQLNLGEITAESFLTEIEDQTKRAQEKLAKSASGEQYGT